MKQGLLVACLPTRNVLESIEASHKMGYRACEISVCLDDKRPNLTDAPESEWRDVCARARDLGMEISALQCHMHNGYGDVDPAVRQNCVDHTKRMIDMAGTMGIDIVQTVSGVAEDDAPHDEKLDRVADCYREILKSVGPGSPQIGMEPVFIYVVGNLAHTDALYERLGETPLMINMDPGHFPFHNESPTPFIRKYGSRIIHAHSKDCVITDGAPPPFEEQDPNNLVFPTPDGERTFRFSEPGSGLLDWDEIMQELKAVGFDGVISLEQGHGYLSDPFECAAETYAFFRDRYGLS